LSWKFNIVVKLFKVLSKFDYHPLMKNFRIAFSNFVSNHKIKNFRRYSIGKAFQEGFYTPTENTECVFEAVTPEIDDFVSDAEMMYIVKQVWESTFPKQTNKILFV